MNHLCHELITQMTILDKSVSMISSLKFFKKDKPHVFPKCFTTIDDLKSLLIITPSIDHAQLINLLEKETCQKIIISTEDLLQLITKLDFTAQHALLINLGSSHLQFLIPNYEALSKVLSKVDIFSQEKLLLILDPKYYNQFIRTQEKLINILFSINLNIEDYQSFFSPAINNLLTDVTSYELITSKLTTDNIKLFAIQIVLFNHLFYEDLKNIYLEKTSLLKKEELKEKLKQDIINTTHTYEGIKFILESISLPCRIKLLEILPINKKLLITKVKQYIYIYQLLPPHHQPLLKNYIAISSLDEPNEINTLFFRQVLRKKINQGHEYLLLPRSPNAPQSIIPNPNTPNSP